MIALYAEGISASDSMGAKFKGWSITDATRNLSLNLPFFRKKHVLPVQITSNLLFTRLSHPKIGFVTSANMNVWSNSKLVARIVSFFEPNVAMLVPLTADRLREGSLAARGKSAAGQIDTAAPVSKSNHCDVFLSKM